MHVRGEEPDVEGPAGERGDAEEEVEVGEEGGDGVSRSSGETCSFVPDGLLDAGFRWDMEGDMGVLPSPSRFIGQRGLSMVDGCRISRKYYEHSHSATRSAIIYPFTKQKGQRRLISRDIAPHSLELQCRDAAREAGDDASHFPRSEARPGGPRGTALGDSIVLSKPSHYDD